MKGRKAGPNLSKKCRGGGFDHPDWTASLRLSLEGLGRQAGMILEVKLVERVFWSTLNIAISLPFSTPRPPTSKSGCRIISVTSLTSLYSSLLSSGGVGPVSHSPQRMTTSLGIISAAPGLLPHLSTFSLQLVYPGVQQHAGSLAPLSSISLQR